MWTAKSTGWRPACPPRAQTPCSRGRVTPRERTYPPADSKTAWAMYAKGSLRRGGIRVVVNDERVVLGLLRSKELAHDADPLIEQAMRPGPSTYRPFATLHELAHVMTEHKLENAPITTSDGRLVGLLLQKDVVEAMKKTK